jgi:hypothetical protein
MQGESEMKKTVLTLLALVMLLSVLSLSASAGPPEEVSGLWQYIPYVKVHNAAGECVPPGENDTRPPCIREADGNTFMQTFETGKWSGSFVGVSTEDGKVVVHRSGDWSFNAIVSFSEVTVSGKSGTLKMSVNGRLSRYDEDGWWYGRWVILSGTGELATLRGQGTWWGPGAPDVGQEGDIWYAGKIHFAP